MTATKVGAEQLENAAVIGKVITGFASSAGVVAATDTLVQAINKLDGNIRAALGIYNTLMNVSASHTTGRTAGTYALGDGIAAAISGTGTLTPVGIIGIYASDFPAVTGMSAKLRIRAQVNCNDTAPTGNFTFGLYPVTRPGISGATALLNTYTIGTVVTGSAGATVSAPAAKSQNSLVSSDFAIPADGQYVIAVVTTATVASPALVHLNAQLQAHYS